MVESHTTKQKQKNKVRKTDRRGLLLGLKEAPTQSQQNGYIPVMPLTTSSCRLAQGLTYSSAAVSYTVQGTLEVELWPHCPR